jgi:crotonobetainyl-CoA:carnitine CoA-transferase CaiB-like acyl-CoA transferase
VTLPNGKQTHLPTLPIAFDGALVARAATLPQPGADSATVLEAWGFTAQEIANLSSTEAAGTNPR